jgi:hypothetical protein
MRKEEINMSNKGEQQPAIPELYIIEELVRKYMPAGHHLKSVDLSFGSLEEGQDPRFVILVKLIQDGGVPEPMGWADKLSKIICQQWPNDSFYVKVHIVLA